MLLVDLQSCVQLTQQNAGCDRKNLISDVIKFSHKSTSSDGLAGLSVLWKQWFNSWSLQYV